MKESLWLTHYMIICLGIPMEFTCWSYKYLYLILFSELIA